MTDLGSSVRRWRGGKRNQTYPTKRRANRAQSGRFTFAMFAFRPLVIFHDLGKLLVQQFQRNIGFLLGVFGEHAAIEDAFNGEIRIE